MSCSAKSTTAALAVPAVPAVSTAVRIRVVPLACRADGNYRNIPAKGDFVVVREDTFVPVYAASDVLVMHESRPREREVRTVLVGDKTSALAYARAIGIGDDLQPNTRASTKDKYPYVLGSDFVVHMRVGNTMYMYDSY